MSKDTILIRSPKSFRRVASIKASLLGISTPKYLDRLACEMEEDIFKVKKSVVKKSQTAIKKDRRRFNNVFKI